MLDKFTKQYNWLFLIVLLFTVFSGAIRKWGVSNNAVGNIILLVQLLVPFIFIIQKGSFKSVFSNRMMGVYILVLVATALNPMNPTIFHGMLGMIVHFGFFFLLNHYIQNRHQIDLRPLIPWIVGVLVLEVVLGFIQYGLPQGHFLNRYANQNALGSKSIATVGNAVRVTGTFSYIGGYTGFIIFAAFIVWFLFRVNYHYRRTIFLLAGALVASLMTGSRGGVFLTLFILGIMFWEDFSGADIKKLLQQLFLPAIVGFAILLATGGGGIIQETINNAYNNFAKRVESNLQSGEQSRRLTGDFVGLLNYQGKYPIYGVGLGSTYQGATATFGSSKYVEEYGYVEGELIRIVLEGGFLLLFVRLLLIRNITQQFWLGRLPKIGIIIMLLFLVPTVFHIYNSVFIAMGLILVDNAYYAPWIEEQTAIEEEEEETEEESEETIAIEPSALTT